MSESIYVLIGAALPLLFNFAQNLINQHYEQKRHLQTTIIKTAFDQWKENIDFAKHINDRGLQANVNSFNDHIIFTAFLTNAVSSKDISEDEIIKAVKSARKVISTLSTIEKKQS